MDSAPPRSNARARTAAATEIPFAYLSMLRFGSILPRHPTDHVRKNSVVVGSDANFATYLHCLLLPPLLRCPRFCRHRHWFACSSRIILPDGRLQIADESFETKHLPVRREDGVSDGVWVYVQQLGEEVRRRRLPLRAMRLSSFRRLHED